MLAAAGIALGFVLAYAAGGSLGRVPELDARVWASLVVLSVVQGLARGRLFGVAATPVGLVAWGVASLVVCVAVSTYASRRGFGAPGMRGLTLVVFGTLLNVLVVLLNQGMPVTGVDGAARQIGASGGFYVHLNEGTFLPSLGDVLVLDVGAKEALLSVGDVVLLVGVATVIVELMLSGRETDPAPPAA